MKGKYFIAAGFALVSFAAFYLLKKQKKETAMQPQRENERHHLTNAFSKAKQVAVGG